MRRPRILLADDHTVVVEGLRRMLRSQHFQIVGAVTDGHALVSAAARLRPDVIISDVAMPRLSGVEAARQIRRHSPDCKIIFFTMHPEVAYAVQAMTAGASGYVLKSSPSRELLAAINAALEGRVFLTKSLQTPVKLALESGTVRTGLAGLTNRQLEVLQLLAEGRQAKEIAAELNLSPRTVEFHKYRIMDLLGVHNVAELVRFAIQHGITG